MVSHTNIAQYDCCDNWLARSASGLDPDARLLIIEQNWAYFVGFGCPSVLLLRSTSFFMGYGIYLALFPVCIILGGLSDHSFTSKSLGFHHSSVPLFHFARQWTLSLLKIASKCVVGKRMGVVENVWQGMVARHQSWKDHTKRPKVMKKS